MRTFLIALLALSACEVGEDVGPGGGGAPDSGGGGGGGGADASGGLAFGPCRDKAPNGLDGHHNPGQSCQGGCHDHGFTLAGTLQTTIAGGTPVVGGAISVRDANGRVFDMISEANGNFYTTQIVTFPVNVIASACPDANPMAGTISQADGNCNKVGCHVAGVGQGSIHVP